MFRTLVDALARSVEKDPSAAAITHEGRCLSYGELYGLAGKVTAHLLQSGVDKGDRIAILAANSPEYIAVYYGILGAGGVAVTLNSQAKARDIDNWLNHCGAKWLFADHRHPELSNIGQATEHTRIVAIGPSGEAGGDGHVGWRHVLEAQASYSPIALKESDPASIIYTSGTTGQPKGITLSHGNLAANISSIVGYLGLTASDSIVDVLPFYYSYGNSVLHTHLCVGARLILANSLLYPHRVVQMIAEERATGFSGVPSTFALLLGRVKLHEYDLTSLRYLTQAGGPMAPALTDRLTASLPQAKLFVMYGQTEATARLTYLPPEHLVEKRGSVGIAIPGVSIEIRDKQHRRVDSGVTGEICARGRNVMQGYWQDETRTREVLKDGWLYTGDLGHYDDDGFIYIDGRSSDMIKTGANRISPKEVEEVIQELAEVQEVAVIGVPDETLGEVIKAFVVPMPGQPLQVRAVQLHCKNNLASYKIPKQVELIDELPKTASGKVKKFLLK